jgi:hypothetical protein
MHTRPLISCAALNVAQMHLVTRSLRGCNEIHGLLGPHLRCVDCSAVLFDLKKKTITTNSEKLSALRVHATLSRNNRNIKIYILIREDSYG